MNLIIAAGMPALQMAQGARSRTVSARCVRPARYMATTARSAHALSNVPVTQD